MGRQRSGEREAYWRDVVSRQAASGQTVAMFCQREKISPPSFYVWRKKLKRQATSPQFVPITISTPATPASAKFEVRLSGGTTVMVPDGFNEAALRRLLQVAREVERGDA